MKKFLLALTAVIVFSSASFAYDEDAARDALIIYSGTESFAYLRAEERSACMAWVADGGDMSELCRSAVIRLISEEPNAVSPSQKQALLAAASGQQSAAELPPSPAPYASGSTTVIREKESNTGEVLAAGVAGVIAGMVIHNNLPKEKEKEKEVVIYYPDSDSEQEPRRPPHRRPPHRRPPHRRPPRY